MAQRWKEFTACLIDRAESFDCQREKVSSWKCQSISPFSRGRCFCCWVSARRSSAQIWSSDVVGQSDVTGDATPVLPRYEWESVRALTVWYEKTLWFPFISGPSPLSGLDDPRERHLFCYYYNIFITIIYLWRRRRLPSPYMCTRHWELRTQTDTSSMFDQSLNQSFKINQNLNIV